MIYVIILNRLMNKIYNSQTDNSHIYVFKKIYIIYTSFSEVIDTYTSMTF